MKTNTLLVMALFASLSFSCKTKKMVAKPNVAAGTELDGIKKQTSDNEGEQTEKGIKFTFNAEVLFPSNSSYLSEAAKTKLMEMTKFFDTKDKQRHIQIDGHTDATGTNEYNAWLSEKRATSVKTFLVAQGIAESRIQTSGKGASQPIETNKTPEGRLKNRRVEITLLK